MRAMLNAVGVSLWGAIAITLAAAVAVLGYRVTLPSYRPEYPPASMGAGSLPAGRTSAPNGTSAGAQAEIQAPRAPPPLSTVVRRRGQTAARQDESADTGAVEPQAEPDSTTTAPSEEPDLIGHYLKPAGPGPGIISRVVAKEMTAAQKALQAHQWAEGLESLEAAERKSPLTAFDQKTIYTFKGFADIKLAKLKDAQGEYEKALAIGNATPEERVNMTRTLLAIAASKQQYRKTIDYGMSLVDSGAASNGNLVLIAQSYYLLKDCKNSGIWADKAVAAARQAGELPKETPFLFKLQCASDAGDMPAMDAALTDLIKVNPKTTYWNTLLRIERQDERDDRNTLMIYRVMNATNSWNADTDYIEMAQLLGDATLPGEAAALLDKAMSNGAIKEEHKERTNRLLTSLRARAEEDRRRLPQEEAEADQSPTGALSVGLGEVYYGFGEYQKTIDAITQGLQKGSVTQMEPALVYLGLAQVQLGRYADAKETLSSIPAPSAKSRSARLWRLYAGTLSSSN